MYTCEGSLNIRVIHGRNGAFSVGRLSTPIGEFTVKDTVLDQYEEGSYAGNFSIERVYPTSYVSGNRRIMEVRASLAGFSLDEVDEECVIDEPEADPVETASVQPVVLTKPPRTEPEPPLTETDDEDPDRQLFGAEIHAQVAGLDGPVKLDPTVDRDLFRKQRDRLKELGYRFDFKEQSWHQPD